MFPLHLLPRVLQVDEERVGERDTIAVEGAVGFHCMCTVGNLVQPRAYMLTAAGKLM